MNAKPLRELRIARGLTQKNLADLSGVHPVTLSRIESGRIEPTVRNLRRIADALNLSMDDIQIGTAAPAAGAA